MQKRASQFKKDGELYKVYKPFDPEAFHFCKTSEKENVLRIRDQSVLKVNISPIFPSHMLLAPRVEECLPQYLDSPSLLHEALSLFRQFTSPSTTFMGYNGIGGFSTINHLHFQMYDTLAFPPPPSKGDLYYSEAVTLKVIASLPSEDHTSQIQLCIHDNFSDQPDSRMYHAFAFQLPIKLSEMTLDQSLEVSTVVMKLPSYLNSRDQPYNILIRDDLIHVIPRQHESALNDCVDLLGFGPAMVELFGVFIVKNCDTWGQYSDDSDSLAHLLIEVIKNKVSLRDDDFKAMQKEVIKFYDSSLMNQEE